MELDKIRQEIDAVDAQMRELFLKRMELSSQVVETKKQTGGAVYVPEREQAVVSERSKDVEQKYLPEYQAFIKQLMGISRTYQYSRLVKQSEKLQNLPEKTGEVNLEFPYRPKTDKLSVALNALALAGLSVKTVTTEMREEKTICQMCVCGDFSTEIAKAAVLQILEEN